MRHKQQVTAALLLVAGLAMSACHTESKVEPPPASPVLARPVSLLFVDAATNQPVTAPLRAVARDANGQLSTVTQDGTGAAATTFTTSAGTVDFQIDSSDTQEHNLTVVASADGYAPTSVRANVAAGGSYQGATRMVRISAPPSGVSAVHSGAGTADDKGACGSAIDVATPPEASSQGKASLSVPAQTTVKASDDTPLSGDLSATMAYFDPSDDSSLDAFPGGLDVTVPSTSTPVSGQFVSGGFAAVQLDDASGKAAKHFSQPVALSIDIAPGTLNPEKNNALVIPGDAIPLWSYDETTGQWQSEGTVTVEANGSGGLKAVGNVTHLSFWNLGWLVNQNLCPSHTATINITGNSQGLALLLVIRAPGFLRFLTVTDSVVNIVNPVVGVPTTITALFNGKVVGTAGPIPNLCGATVNLPVTLPAVTPAGLSVAVKHVCKQDATKTTPVPSAGVFVITLNGILSGQTDATGKATFTGLAVGQSVAVVSQGVVVSTTLATATSSIIVPIPVNCLTGAAGGTP
jgi:hypothetical protein